MAESHGEWTGNSCLSSNAEMQRSLKQEEVTQKEYGDTAQAEELNQRIPRNASTGKQGQKDG